MSVRIAISNIAWDADEDTQITRLLKKYSIDAIDVAPGKYFVDPSKVSLKDIVRVKTQWADNGIEITGMQGLLFGTKGLNMFGSKKSRDKMLSHLSHQARIASGLGATRLVFGSPKNRNREGLSDSQASEIAESFFSRLGDIAKIHNVDFCLEPNPAVYGSNFMTSTKETYDVVSAINHPAIKMQLDTGAIAIAEESISEIMGYSKDRIGHIHISDPGLSVIGDGDVNHIENAKVLTSHFKDPLICIEMVSTNEEPHPVSVERALAFVTNIYRGS